MMISVNINNQTYTLSTPINLAEALTQLNILGRGIAVAVNNQVAARASWETRQLSDGDKLLIIRATQGG